MLFVQLSPTNVSEAASAYIKNLSILTFLTACGCQSINGDDPSSLYRKFSPVSKRDYYPHSISLRHMGVACFCWNCENRLAQAGFLNFCVRRSWFCVLCVFEKIQSKDSKNFLFTMQDFREKVWFPMIFLIFLFVSVKQNAESCATPPLYKTRLADFATPAQKGKKGLRHKLCK